MCESLTSSGIFALGSAVAVASLLSFLITYFTVRSFEKDKSCFGYFRLPNLQKLKWFKVQAQEEETLFANASSVEQGNLEEDPKTPEQQSVNESDGVERDNYTTLCRLQKELTARFTLLRRKYVDLTCGTVDAAFPPGDMYRDVKITPDSGSFSAILENVTTIGKYVTNLQDAIDAEYRLRRGYCAQLEQLNKQFGSLVVEEAKTVNTQST